MSDYRERVHKRLNERYQDLLREIGGDRRMIDWPADTADGFLTVCGDFLSERQRRDLNQALRDRDANPCGRRDVGPGGACVAPPRNPGRSTGGGPQEQSATR